MVLSLNFPKSSSYFCGMKVKLSRQNKNLWFKAENKNKNTVNIDGPSEKGGVNKGMRPMELLLSSLVSCAAFDLSLILEKQKLNPDAIDAEVIGMREQKGSVMPFSAIDITFLIQGNIPEKKANRAAELAIQKYCSVKSSLHPEIKITHQVKIIKD